MRFLKFVKIKFLGGRKRWVKEEKDTENAEGYGKRFGLHYPKNPKSSLIDKVVAKNTSWYNQKGERLGGGKVFSSNIRCLMQNLRGREVFIILPKGIGLKKMMKGKEVSKRSIGNNKEVRIV